MYREINNHLIKWKIVTSLAWNMWGLINFYKSDMAKQNTKTSVFLNLEMYPHFMKQISMLNS